MWRSSPILAAALLALCACAGEPRSAPSAGGATATGFLSISATPIQTIAPADSEGIPVFGNIADATRLSSGIVAVVDRRVDAVMFIDSMGRLVRQSGRSGDGPGEFRSVVGIGQCAPDTLFVWDRMNDRMSLLDATGALLRSYRPPGNPVDRFCAGSAQYLVWTSLSAVGNATAEAPPVRGTTVLVSADGDSVGGLGDVQAGEIWPLGAVTQFAVTDAGIYMGTADTGVVSLYGRSGQMLRSVDVGNARRTTTAAEYDAALSSLINTVPGTAEQVASMREFMLKRFPMPKYLPAYRAILANGSGAVFVVTSPLGDGVTGLQAFDLAGGTLGELRIPGDVEVYEIGTDYLLGMLEDAEGEQQLVVYAVSVEVR